MRSQQVHLRLLVMEPAFFSRSVTGFDLCATISAHPTAPPGSWVGEVGAFVLLTVLVSTSFTSYDAFVSECSPARLATFRRRPLLDFHIHFAAKLVTTTFSGRQQRLRDIQLMNQRQEELSLALSLHSSWSRIFDVCQSARHEPLQENTRQLSAAVISSRLLMIVLTCSLQVTTSQNY